MRISRKELATATLVFVASVPGACLLSYLAAMWIGYGLSPDCPNILFDNTPAQCSQANTALNFLLPLIIIGCYGLALRYVEHQKSTPLLVMRAVLAPILGVAVAGCLIVPFMTISIYTVNGDSQILSFIYPVYIIASLLFALYGGHFAVRWTAKKLSIKYHA